MTKEDMREPAFAIGKGGADMDLPSMERMDSAVQKALSYANERDANESEESIERVEKETSKEETTTGIITTTEKFIEAGDSDGILDAELKCDVSESEDGLTRAENENVSPPDRLQRGRRRVPAAQRPGAYSEAPGADLQRNRTFSKSRLNSTPHSTGKTDASSARSIQTGETLSQEWQEAESYTGSGLMEARQVHSEEFRVVGEATAMNPETRDRNLERQRTGQKSIWFAVLVVALVGVGVATSLTLVFASKANQEVAPPGPFEDSMRPTTAGELPEEVVYLEESEKMVDLGDLPDYTATSLKDPFSPQSHAYHWLSQHRNLTNLPRWRQRQLFALGCMYYSFNGPEWPLGLSDDWLDDSKSECDWYSGLYGFFSMADGVTYGEHETQGFACDEGGRMHTIRVATADRFGFSYANPSFPPEVSWLTSLKYLGMAENGLSNFSSPQLFPPQFYELTNLEFLNLGSNPTNKPIPSELGLLTKLTRLGLFHTNATGTIPTELGLLTNMIRLDLNGNRLTGTIPSELFSLGRIRVNDNSLHGTIPSEMGRLTDTWGLRFNNNPLLAGDIPSELGLLTQLRGYFRVDNTNVSGTIPETFCSLGVDGCTYVTYDGDESSCSLQFDCSNQLCGCDCACL